MSISNTLYLSYDGMTDPLGQSQVLPYIIGLTKKGHQFTLISFEKPERFEQGRGTIEKICIQNNIDWQPQIYTKTPPILSTIKDILSLKKLVLQLHKKKSLEIIHCRSYITALIGLMMKRRYGVKFIFDMRGFWADERIDGKIWSKKNPIHKVIYKYFKRKELDFLEEADYVISLTYNAKSIIHSWSHLKNQPIPIEVIPCCVDLLLFDPSKVSLKEQKQLRADLDITTNDFILTYLGSIGTWYMLDEMLDFFKVLKKNRTQAKFFFITAETPEQILTKATTKQIDSNDIIIKKAKRIEVPLYLSIADLGIFFILPVFSKKASSPTKQGEMMAMGLPILCNTAVGDTDKVIKDYEAGLLVEEFSETAYEKTVFAIDRLWSKYRITQGSQEFYGLEEGVKRYQRVYEEVSETRQ